MFHTFIQFFSFSPNKPFPPQVAFRSWCFTITIVTPAKTTDQLNRWVIVKRDLVLLTTLEKGTNEVQWFPKFTLDPAGGLSLQKGKKVCMTKLSWSQYSPIHHWSAIVLGSAIGLTPRDLLNLFLRNKFQPWLATASTFSFSQHETPGKFQFLGVYCFNSLTASVVIL